LPAVLCGAALAFGLVAAPAAPSDLRSSVIELEWRSSTGYERCAGVVTARDAHGLVAWTAAHCALRPYAIVRFFDGFMLPGSAVRVIALSETVDKAELGLTVDSARARLVPPAVAARTVPALGSLVQIIGHPIAALRGPLEGRWTVTFGRMGETVLDPQSGAPQYEVYCSRCGPGDSGSGVFDADGRLLGIVYGVTEIENVANGRLPDGRYADVIPVGALR